MIIRRIAILLLLTAAAFAQTDNLSLSPSRPVTPGPHGLSAEEFAPNLDALRRLADELRFQLPGGQVVVLRREGGESREQGDVLWRGTVLFEPGSQVLLTVRGGLVAGSIRKGADVFEIRPERARHVIERLNLASFPPCAGGLVPNQPIVRAEPASAVVAAAETAQIHLLSMYTPQARAASGGDAEITALIQAAVDSANQAFTNSGINARYTLLQTALANRNDSGDMSSDLDWLKADPATAALRNQSGADMVSLVVSNGGNACGIGYVMRIPGPAFEGLAFQVSARGCIIGNSTFAHEHGHNLGMEHDPANGPSPSSASYPWSFGHYVNGVFRTVMSYSTGCTSGCADINFFSNPAVTYIGVPTGIIDQRDNARTANLTAPIAAAFRQSLSQPSAVSVTPSSGGGTSQTFSFLFSDPNGFTDVSEAYMLVNTSLNWPGGCYTFCVRPYNQLYLLNDAGNYWIGPITLGGSEFLTNSQCTVNAAASSVSGSGNNLTVNLALNFTPAFNGAKSVYMNARDKTGLWSNWQQRGTWTATGGIQPPSAVSVTPASGGGQSQTFSFLFSDPNGVTDLSTTYMLIHPQFNWAGACYTSYVRGANALWLLNDSGTLWLGPLTPGGAGTLTNSQCTLSAGASSVSGSGNNLTVNVALIFTGNSPGSRNVYMNAQDNEGLWSGWQLRGSWTVPFVPRPPTVDSVGPASGSGTVQQFSFSFTDPNGWNDLSTLYMLINTSLNWPGGCYISYLPNANTLWLLNDAGNFWLGPVKPGVGGTLSNGRCVLDGYRTSFWTLSYPGGTGYNTLILNPWVTFLGAFAGAKNVYMNAQDNAGLWSNWQIRGSWTVPAGGNQPPTSVSVTPAAGSGAVQTFSFLFSDPNSDFSTTYMLINATLNWPGSCYTYYARGSNTLWLLNDAGNFWLGPVTPGSPGTLANSQCSLNAWDSATGVSGNNLTVNTTLTFTGAFAGTKNVYMNAQNNSGLWSNWQLRGAWTVP